MSKTNKFNVKGNFNNLLKKGKMLSLVILSTVSLTACSLQFNTKNPNQTLNTIIPNEITEIITNQDSINIENLEDTITTIREETTKIAEETNSEFIKANLVRVVDGDTIVVEIEDNQYKVRLIGIDTPESVASQEYLDRTGKENTIEGKSASDYTKELLSNYTEVYLQKDISETDRYGRLLRYVWLEIPNNDKDINEIASKMLNGMLVADHIANVVTYNPDITHQNDFQYIYDNFEDFDR